jgi:hypothetical protein
MLHNLSSSAWGQIIDEHLAWHLGRLLKWLCSDSMETRFTFDDNVNYFINRLWFRDLLFHVPSVLRPRLRRGQPGPSPLHPINVEPTFTVFDNHNFGQTGEKVNITWGSLPGTAHTSIGHK